MTPRTQRIAANDRDGTARPAAARVRPWWLEEEVPCGYCLQRHALHMAVRCSGCDGEVCRDCASIVRRSRVVYCPDCSASRTARR